MKKLLAVSGGIDSMVMLDAFRGDPEAIVAHFNHGMRPSAGDDERFVREAAERLGKRFFVGYGNLGENTSEAEARKARYGFLREVADREEAEIFTAHHADDLIETMAINLIRGTRWRGAAPFGNREVRRPFIETGLLPGEIGMAGKEEIYRYAAERRIVYREDPTNNEGRYLRNRVRVKIRELSEMERKGLMKIYYEVNNIREEVEAILGEIVPEGGIFERETFREAPEEVCLEILRFALLGKGITATRPQLADFLEAIRSYPAGKSFNLPKGEMVRMGKTSFRI